MTKSIKKAILAIIEDEELNDDQLDAIKGISDGEMTVKNRLITPEYLSKVFGIKKSTFIEARFARKTHDYLYWYNMDKPGTKALLVALLVLNRGETGCYYCPAPLYDTEEEKQHILDIVKSAKKLQECNDPDYDGGIDLSFIDDDKKLSYRVKEYISTYGFHVREAWERDGGGDDYCRRVELHELISVLNRIAYAEVDAFHWV